MIKKTLYFGNPAYLSLRMGQLVVQQPTDDGPPIEKKTIPIEDIGVVMLDHKQITITQALLEALLAGNCDVVTCDSSHLPVGLMLPLSGNSVQNVRFRVQLDASLPLRKQLWQQTIQYKIHNQYVALHSITGEWHNNMKIWSESVRSGDPDNLEARAAEYYWKNFFPKGLKLHRGDDDLWPNNLLNYGYAIVRAVIARALVSTGLLPTLGIHHHNKYDAYCLADDIMEPYRPYVDLYVCRLMEEMGATGETELTPAIKARLLSIPTSDVTICDHRSPLMVAASTTTASLYRCFSGESRRISYPCMT